MNGVVYCINQFSDQKTVCRQEQKIIVNQTQQVCFDHGKAQVALRQTGENQYQLILTVCEGTFSQVNLGAYLHLDWWNEEDGYFFSPAAVYDGNRFKVLHQTYPPMMHREDGMGPEMQTLITDVPRLNQEHTYIHLSSGDMSVPCMGGWGKKAGKGILFYGNHGNSREYTGFFFDQIQSGARIGMESPCVRTHQYTMMNTSTKSDDQPRDLKAGDVIQFCFGIHQFDCHSMKTFYEYFFDTREWVESQSKWENQLPFSAAYDIIEQKTTQTQFEEEQGYFRVSPKGTGGVYGDWQAGWVGGGMNACAFMMGSEGVAVTQAEETFQTIYSPKLQAETGFIYPIRYNGKLLGDDFHHTEQKEILLLRKNADVLVYTAKYCLSREKRNLPEQQQVTMGLKKLADAFVRLFRKYGQLGQFIDLEREEILAGGTASPAIAIEGLALCSRVLKDLVYLETAQQLGDWYAHCLEKGLLNGGPGEILQGADSESVFGLLEGYMALYHADGQEKWLLLAADCSHQASSWCMTYDFDFPENCEFGRLGMHTTGSVFANVQNKHSAPGICTLSPIALLDLAREALSHPQLSGRSSAYAKLARQIAHNITQYLSREDRPIMSWEGKPLPAGWMCERVNTSDWEGKDHIGGVFCGSCWCEVSTLMTAVEIPGMVVNSDSGMVWVYDHVDVVSSPVSGGFVCTITNPTQFTARVAIAVCSETHSVPYGEPGYLMELPRLTLLPGETKNILVNRGENCWHI